MSYRLRINYYTRESASAPWRKGREFDKSKE